MQGSIRYCVATDPATVLWTAAVSMALATAISLAADLGDGLEGYWKFDEQNGLSAMDFSGKGHHGRLMNFPTNGCQWVPGKFGNALEFRGYPHDYVHAVLTARPGTRVTFSAWVWVDSAPPWAKICDQWDEYGGISLNLFSVWGRLGVAVWRVYPGGGGGGGSDTDYAVLTPGSWHHVGLMADGPWVWLWRDGICRELDVDGWNGVASDVPRYLDIGGNANNDVPQNTNTFFWDGKLDDIACWSRCLSEGEMRTIYELGVRGLPLADLLVTNQTLKTAIMPGRKEAAAESPASGLPQ